MELVFSFIAAMLAGICIILMGIARDLREFIDDMHEVEKEEKEK